MWNCTFSRMKRKQKGIFKSPFLLQTKLLILVLSENLSNHFRSKMEHAHLFEAMSTRNAMIKANINGTELLIFSSKQLDQTSQCMPTCIYIYTVHNFSMAPRITSVFICVAVFLKKQYKTENYLWGFFLSQAHVPGTSHHLDDGNVVDMDIDPEDQKTLGLTLQPIAVSQSTSSSLPPGFRMIWTPTSSRPC